MPRHSRKMKGGNGAAEFGVATFGAAGAQHAGPDGSIAMAGSSSVPSLSSAVPSPSQSGGKRQKKSQKGGKTFLADLVVPAGLVYFQQRATKKRGGKRQQTRKSRGSRKQK